MPCNHPMLRRLGAGRCAVCEPELSAPPTTRPSRTRAVERERCRRSFAAFVRAAWPTIEPTRELLPSVAVDALCAALQAVGEGRIRRLAIACPPGVSKSLVAAVAFPAWLLLRSRGAARVMAGSYSHDFATRDSRRCRDLIASPWYQALVAGAWSLRPDADRRDDFWTTTGGRRLVVSPAGKSIGERCTVQIVDDALSAADVHSPAAKKEAARWLTEVLPSRLEDPDHDARVLVGQRLCVDDPLAVAIERGWRYLRLPALAGDDPCELLDDAGELVWRDPRAPGEPLVSLLSPAALADLRADLGSAAFGAQYDQSPADDSAAIVKRSWWRRYQRSELPARFDRTVISCDPTFGSAKGDYAVAQVWAARGGQRFLLDEWRARAGLEVTLGALRGLAARFPGAAILVEKAALGAGIVETLQRELPGVIPVTPVGNKQQRLSAIAPQVESGGCLIPADAPWVDEWVDELALATKHDDRADAASYALTYLAAADPARDVLRRHYRVYGQIPDAARRRGLVDQWVEWAVDNHLASARGERTFAWKPPAEVKAEERPWCRKAEPEPPAKSAADNFAEGLTRGGYGFDAASGRWFWG